MMSDLIYFDNNATTQPLEEVVEAMQSPLREGYANPSSVHRFGQAVRYRVECAREQVASLIGASSKEIVFTSSGTESINCAIRGSLHLRPDCRNIVTTAVEHTATISVMEHLQSLGYTVDYVGVDREGRIREDEWQSKITDKTALVTFLHANNETGVLFDVERMAGPARERGIPVHVDVVQSLGKVGIDVGRWPIQLLSLSAHKFHGPKGVGALYVRRRVRVEPLLLGGEQESGRRGGTENVSGIVGMGVAAEAALKALASHSAHVGALRDRLEHGLLSRISLAHVNGRGSERLCNTTNIGFEGLGAEAVLMLLSEAGICASAGSACSSGSLEPSHVLKAMGIDERIAHGAIRFSLSGLSTESEVDRALETIPGLIAKLSALNCE